MLSHPLKRDEQLGVSELSVEEDKFSISLEMGCGFTILSMLLAFRTHTVEQQAGVVAARRGPPHPTGAGQRLVHRSETDARHEHVAQPFAIRHDVLVGLG